MAAQAPAAMATLSQPDDSLPPYSSSAPTPAATTTATNVAPTPTTKLELKKKFEVKIDLVPDAADPTDPQDWLCTIEFKVHNLEQVMRKGLAWTGANVVKGKGFYNDRLRESTDTRFTVKRTWCLRDNPSLPEAQNAWTATAKIWAHEIPQLASFRLGKLGRGNVSIVKAHNEEGKRVFCYERLKSQNNINVYLDDDDEEDDGSVKATPWWFWPVDGRGIVGEGVVERVKGETKGEEKKANEGKKEKVVETKEVETAVGKVETETKQAASAPPSKSWSLLRFSFSVNKAAEKNWKNEQQKKVKQKGKQDAKPAPDAQNVDKKQQDDKKKDAKDEGKQKQKGETGNGKSLTKSTTDQQDWSFAVSWSIFEFARSPRGQQAGEGTQGSGGRFPWRRS